MLTRNIIMGVDGFVGFPDSETFCKNELARLYEKFPTSPSREEIVIAKANRRSLKSLAKEHKITYNTLGSICLLQGVDTKFDQVPREIHTKLSKECLETHLSLRHSAEFMAKKYNVSPSFILQKLHTHGLNVQPSFTSVGELELKSFIESLGFKPTKHKTKKYEIDVFVPELNIGFEYNGIYWHSKFPRKYHQEKYLMAKEDGIRLIQIWDIDWINKRTLIERKVSHVLGKNVGERIFARNTFIDTVSSTELRSFYEENHIQGYKYVKHNFVLRTDSGIVAAISFQRNKIERYATSSPVIGGFSKLLKHSVNALSLETVETFADLFWSDHLANQYVKMGFKLVSITPPNYFWCKGGEKHSRIKFQKHKLKSLPNYCDAKTEEMMMYENKYIRVFDAGNAKFVLDIV